MEIVEVISVKPHISLSHRYVYEDMETQMQQDKYQYLFTRHGILICKERNS
jgi:hypothetical protein